jgi:hypothetical protein
MKYYILTSILFIFFVSCKNEKPFTIVLLPDTQCYSESYPEIFKSQTSWIADHSDEITFVLHQGDITDDNTLKEWEVAADAFSIMDGKVPYTFVPGNHDMDFKEKPGTRNSDMMNKYLPYDKYSKLPSFGGAYEVRKMDNTWHKFSAGGIKWIILSLEFGPRTSVLEWAGGIIEQHPDHKVIINTHAYLYSDDLLMSEKHDHKWLPTTYPIGKNEDIEYVNNGDQVWEKLIKKYPNIFMVVNGHVLNDGTGQLVGEGIHGNKVYQMLANYQCGVNGAENGGNGFLRMIEINPAESTITVTSYSPYLDEFKEEDDHHFVIEGVEF